jgi:multisubunit Na+/H+ antiporter MnhB subunit
MSSTSPPVAVGAPSSTRSLRRPRSMLAVVVWVLVGLIALLILYPVLTTVVLTIEDAFLTPDAFVLDPAISIFA